MEILRQVTGQLELGWAYLSTCLGAPLSAPACRSARTWVTIALLVIGLIVLWKLLAWIVRPLRTRLADMRLRAREREVADADTMARYKVDDSKLFSPPGEDNVARQIRDALDRKKIDEKQQRHHQTLGEKKL
jgi:flagellar biosynthesis/type III secretory pathway M-ring protein FliF/YscJ